MNNYQQHAMREFQYAGWCDENGKFTDEMQEQICDGVMKLLELFDKEGHSGSSAPYAINLFKTLARFEPIGPLTGADDEWVRHDYGDTPTYQNKRMGSVFKQADRFNGQAYWIDGKVFWEWYSAPDIEDGKPFKSYYTSADSFVVIEFPWVKPESSEYVFVPTEQFPNEGL
jgi:hypothetical protein